MPPSVRALDRIRRHPLRLPMPKTLIAAFVLAAGTATAPALALAQQPTVKPEETEVWSPVPSIVSPGATSADAPSDAIRLFDGTDLHEWVAAGTKNPAQWTVHDGIVTVNKKAGDIETKRSFNDYQLHLEWQVPAAITGS